MKRGKPGNREDAVTVAVVRLPHGRGLDLPAYQSDGAAGMDLLAAVAKGAPLQLAPGARALVPTGLVLQLPLGFEAQVRPRSGLALRHGITVLNSPGTIDSDYRGEVQVLLANLGKDPFSIARGERIAQLVVAARRAGATRRSRRDCADATARRRRLRLHRRQGGKGGDSAERWRSITHRSRVRSRRLVSCVELNEPFCIGFGASASDPRLCRPAQLVEVNTLPLSNTIITGLPQTATSSSPRSRLLT